jgi:hypothetical protein
VQTDNVEVVSAFRPLTNVTPALANATSMGDRPFINVACFWGPPANPAMNGVQKLEDLKPEMATQHARFYPAMGDQPAVIFSAILQMKGRDIQGVLNTLPGTTPPPITAGSISNVTMKTRDLRGVPPPTDPRAFVSAGPVATAAIDKIRRLGIPVDGR